MPASWRTRRAVKVKVVMGFEGQNYDVELDHPVYSRKANPELHAVAALWVRELQPLLDAGSLSTQSICELEGGFEGVIRGLEMLQNGEIKGEKLVAKVI